jgi:RNA polymerase I-specific transcription initiation factor RRN3
VPTAGSRLLPLVVGNFPHKLRDRNTQCLYLRGTYALAEGPAGGAVREGLLAGVLEHLIGIDVEIRWVGSRGGGGHGWWGWGGMSVCVWTGLGGHLRGRCLLRNLGNAPL